MFRAKPRPAWVALALVVLVIALIAWWSSARRPSNAEPLGLFTTLPILWADSPDLGAELNPGTGRHWAAEQLARRGAIEPLDVLVSGAGHAPLSRVRRLVMAQPRVLGPQENVALDEWVRGGGQLLLLADPALTEESSFALADPRRPQAVVLISPILARWGLELRFDAGQTMGETGRDVMGVAMPVNLPGHFVTQDQGTCRIWADGLAVTCAIGQGRVVALADAAVLERDDPAGSRGQAWSSLLDVAFATR